MVGGTSVNGGTSVEIVAQLGPQQPTFVWSVSGNWHMGKDQTSFNIFPMSQRVELLPQIQVVYWFTVGLSPPSQFRRLETVKPISL